MSSSAFPYTTQPHKPLPAGDPQARADILHVLEHGYVILENQFPTHVAQAAKDEIDRLSGEDPEAGRNPFEGLNTNRIYSLLNKSRAFDQFVILPRVLALNDYFLEPGYCLTAFHTIQINAGERAQALHHDDAFAALPRPRPPLGAAIIVAFDDFTATNGATRVVPRSHLLPSGVRPDPSEAIPAVCPAGSVVYFISTTWHSGGENRSSKPRKSLTAQYCQPYVRIYPGHSKEKKRPKIANGTNR
jgi:ectoine hydroxylase-related dioxygenase (phytanoyl-CoA dioxygenase family)